MTPDEARRMVLLEATLREMLRIADATEQCGQCVAPSSALEGEHARAWQSIVRKARFLTGRP
jgi:hypothetical protein